MSKSKIAGLALLVPIGLLGFYCLVWIMGYWGGDKALFSLPEFITTIVFGLFVLGLILYTKETP